LEEQTGTTCEDILSKVEAEEAQIESKRTANLDLVSKIDSVKDMIVKQTEHEKAVKNAKSLQQQLDVAKRDQKNNILTKLESEHKIAEKKRSDMVETITELKEMNKIYTSKQKEFAEVLQKNKEYILLISEKEELLMKQRKMHEVKKSFLAENIQQKEADFIQLTLNPSKDLKLDTINQQNQQKADVCKEKQATLKKLKESGAEKKGGSSSSGSK